MLHIPVRIDGWQRHEDRHYPLLFQEGNHHEDRPLKILKRRSWMMFLLWICRNFPPPVITIVATEFKKRAVSCQPLIEVYPKQELL